MRRMAGKDTTFEEVAAALQRGRRFVLTSHINPDGDALGCSLALAELLDGLGKQVTVYNESRVPARYAYLPTAGRVSRRLPTAFDTAVFLECPDHHRVGERVDTLMQVATTVINIDHHVSNSRYGTINYIDSSAAALGELLHPFFGHFDVPVTKAAAVALWTSLMTDTGSFRYDNTRPQTLRLAADMLEHGIDPAPIYDSVYERRSPAGLRLLGRAFTAAELIAGGRIAWVAVPHAWFRETGGTPEDLGTVAEDLRGVTGVEVSVVLREDRPGKVKVSMRSRSDADVHAIAKQFGGGGHVKAAGCTIRATLDDARAQVLAALCNALAPPS